MTFAVRFAPEAADQLQSLYRYVAEASSPQVAADYVEAIVAHCEGLAVFPYRGTMRDDLRPGLRTTVYKKRVVIAIVVDDAAQRVDVLGIFAGGQDYEAVLTD